MRLREPCRDSCVSSSDPQGPQHPGPIGQGSVLQSAAPPPVCWHQTSRWLTAGPCSPGRKCRPWPRGQRGRVPARGGAGPSLSRVNATHTLLTGPPYSKRKNGEDQSRRSLAGEPGISRGERGGSQRPGMGPLDTLNKRPNAWGSPCCSGRRRATTALPSVLNQRGGPSPFQPREVPKKPERRGGHRKSSRSFFHICNIGLPLRQTHQ